jgi:hypothetical protein
MKTYLVVYTEFLIVKDGNGKENKTLTDNYEAFRGEEGQSEEKANHRYNELLGMDNIYSASLTEVVKSTDY